MLFATIDERDALSLGIPPVAQEVEQRQFAVLTRTSYRRWSLDV